MFRDETCGQSFKPAAALWFPLLDSRLREALTEPVFDKAVRDSKYRIQTWTVSQSRHISQLRRASLVTVTKELICVKWSKAHIWAW